LKSLAPFSRPRKDKAVRFVREVCGDTARAAEVDDEAVEDYAARRRIDIGKPKKEGHYGDQRQRAD
jgi:hypothetical protein